MCHYHGGAPGTGAPKGNQNHLKHGFLAAKYRNLHALAAINRETVSERAKDFEDFTGLKQEKAIVRVLIRDAIEAKRPMDEIVLGMPLLARMERVEHEITPRGQDVVVEAIAEAFEKLGDQMGLKEFTE